MAGSIISIVNTHVTRGRVITWAFIALSLPVDNTCIDPRHFPSILTRFPFVLPFTFSHLCTIHISFVSFLVLRSLEESRTLSVLEEKAVVEMEDLEPFNSSDIEFSPVRKRYANAGAASIASMRDRLFEDRISSKKKVRGLTDVRGALSTQYGRVLWLNRLENHVRGTGMQ
jgi:hypothetical protein